MHRITGYVPPPEGSGYACMQDRADVSDRLRGNHLPFAQGAPDRQDRCVPHTASIQDQRTRSDRNSSEPLPFAFPADAFIDGVPHKLVRDGRPGASGHVLRPMKIPTNVPSMYWREGA